MPNYRQIFEDAAKVTSDDPQVAELCEMFQEFGARRMSGLEIDFSSWDENSWFLHMKSNSSIASTNSFRNDYWKKLENLAEERGISFDNKWKR